MAQEAETPQRQTAACFSAVLCFLCGCSWVDSKCHSWVTHVDDFDPVPPRLHLMMHKEKLWDRILPSLSVSIIKSASSNRLTPCRFAILVQKQRLVNQAELTYWCTHQPYLAINRSLMVCPRSKLTTEAQHRYKMLDNSDRCMNYWHSAVTASETTGSRQYFLIETRFAVMRSESGSRWRTSGPEQQATST